MSEAHNVIHRIYAAFGRRDLRAISESMDEGAQIDFTKSMGPDSGVYPGTEGVERLLRVYWDAFEELSIEVEDFADGSEGIVAFVVARGTGKGSGVSVEARGPHLWCFKDRKPVRLVLYQDKEKALEAAGLSE